jgi:hypothetical protein
VNLADTCGYLRSSGGEGKADANNVDVNNIELAICFARVFAESGQFKTAAQAHIYARSLRFLV